MTELTKEQLIEEAKLKIAIVKCHPNSGMAQVDGELFKIALASLEAEPVAWKATFTQIDHEYNTFTAMYSDKAEAEQWVRLHEIGDFRADITPLYAAPPAQAQCIEVAVNDDMAYAFHHALSDSSPGADEVEEIKTGLRAAFANVTTQPAPVVPEFETWFNSQESGRSICSTQIRRSLQEISWNACCAAMLQGKDDGILTNEDTKGDVQVRELTMLIKQLVSQLRKAKPDCKLPEKAMVYLKRNGLISAEDILR